ncbi:MAG: Hsp33 family molecular chaperone HslO [Nevskia sp.]|nr:Hsp33 family molecular chaperone HslO [Nevskia sp.]
MNLLTGFTFENHVAHGAIVELSSGVAELLNQREYSDDVRRLVGEALAAMPLLATHLIDEGRINLQFQGEGAMKLLVAQVDQALQVRAMAKADAGLSGDFPQLLYGGLLALMLEPVNVVGAEPRPASQALVLIEGARLSDALEGYFERSEQLPTLIRLAADQQGRVAGFLLQRLPSEGLVNAEIEWEHLQTLASTLTSEELLAADAATILHRLFHAEALRVFEPRPVTVACRCSRAGIARMLLSLGREEVESIIAEQGRVAVTCEFCGREYVFTPLEAAELLIPSGTAPGSPQMH